MTQLHSNDFTVSIIGQTWYTLPGNTTANIVWNVDLVYQCCCKRYGLLWIWAMV